MLVNTNDRQQEGGQAVFFVFFARRGLVLGRSDVDYTIKYESTRPIETSCL